jgi:hypothetical protein
MPEAGSQYATSTAACRRQRPETTPSADGLRFTRCPLTRIVSNDTTDITSIIVRLKDGSASQQISCHATSCSALGDACSVGSAVGTGTTFTGTSSLGLGDVAAFNNGYAYIHCTPPSDSTPNVIYSYRATD